MFYSWLKPLLFRCDPEWIHHRVMGLLAWIGGHSWARRLVGRGLRFEDPRLSSRCFGLSFPNPVGLAAGFDKNALAVPVWPELGFGAVEIGSVTALAQPGNPRPRLFRLPADQALINRMGFNNDGCEAIAARLAETFRRHGRPRVPLGVNLGKSKVTPLEGAPEDYRRSMAALWPFADYFVINVSSPNTPGLRQLQDRERLELLLQTVSAYADERARTEGPRRPILVKIAPDLTDEQLDEIVDLARAQGVAGLIATNTTLSREGLKTEIDEAGGLSGRPLADRALQVLRRLRARAGDQLPLVAVGGIFTPEDAYQRIRAGACLVQVYTGFVYQGPDTARRIAEGLARLLERDGFSRLEQAIGVDARPGVDGPAGRGTVPLQV